MIELSFNLDIPTISLAAVTTTQKMGLDSRSFISAFGTATTGLGLFSDDNCRLGLALGLCGPAIACRSGNPTAHLFRASYRLILVACELISWWRRSVVKTSATGMSPANHEPFFLGFFFAVFAAFLKSASVGAPLAPFLRGFLPAFFLALMLA